MANRHKITIYVKPKRSGISIGVRGTGHILGLPLTGFSLDLLDLPLPTTLSEKLYLEAIMTAVQLGLAGLP